MEERRGALDVAQKNCKLPAAADAEAQTREQRVATKGEGSAVAQWLHRAGCTRSFVRHGGLRATLLKDRSDWSCSLSANPLITHCHVTVVPLVSDHTH
jgi:hypothetical protein